MVIGPFPRLPPRVPDSASPELSLGRLPSRSGCRVRPPPAVPGRAPAAPPAPLTASSGVWAAGGEAGPGEGRPGGGGAEGAEGAGAPGPINLHQAAAGGPLGANGKMEGPVGRAGRASFVLLPAPLAAAPAPPLPPPPPPRAPHFRFKPLEGMGGGLRGGAREEKGSWSVGTELEMEEGAQDAEGKGVR